MAKVKLQNSKLVTLSLAVLSLILAVAFLTKDSSLTAAGFDDFGYNYKAMLFNGKVDGADRNLDGTYWGDKTYANDKLVMKWSKAWNDARFDGKPWTCDAWVDNEWNGKVANGSNEVWHYKIVWVGPELAKSKCWREGGYPIWGQFEVVMSQGSVANKHFWDAHAARGGYGIY